MPLRRTLRGRPIKRTGRFGTDILVIFVSQPRGSPGPRLVLPLAQYLAEVCVTFEPRQVADPAAS